MINLKLYTNNSRPNVIVKRLTNCVETSGVLNNKISITRPLIALKHADFNKFSQLNYMTTDCFGRTRCYFLKDVTYTSNIAICQYEIDIISTYADLLENSNCDVFEISENYSDNLRFVDRPTTTSTTRVDEYPLSDLDVDENIVLIIGEVENDNIES